LVGLEAATWNNPFDKGCTCTTDDTDPLNIVTTCTKTIDPDWTGTTCEGEDPVLEMDGSFVNTAGEDQALIDCTDGDVPTKNFITFTAT